MLTFNGTGANVLALTALARPGDAAICSEWAHVNVDETGAPGADRRHQADRRRRPPTASSRPSTSPTTPTRSAISHHAQPAIVSITQSTELGTVYTADEIAALCDAAHRHGMRVHLDGARIANAVAAAGGTVAALRAMTTDAGVDVMSFGGTKNGHARRRSGRVPRSGARACAGSTSARP